MLETERLILRRFNKNDVGAVFALRKDAEMMRYIREPQNNRSETENWINLVSSLWTTEKVGLCAVIDKSSGKLIGWCGLWRLTETGETELGYAIDKTFWSKGLATEAAEAFLHYGFDTLQLDKIVSVARPENTASRRVMEKIGMTFDDFGKFYGREMAHHSISRKSWIKNQAAKRENLLSIRNS